MGKWNRHNDVQFIVTNKHAQAVRLYNLLKGRKCDVTLKQSKTRSLIKVSQ